MAWITLTPAKPYTGAPITFSLSHGAFRELPHALVLESQEGSYSLPVSEGNAYVTLMTPGNYRISTEAYSLDFEVARQGAIPIQTELFLTIGLVLVGLGGLLRWIQKRKAGSTSRSGQD